jgi:hypothetical protein
MSASLFQYPFLFLSLSMTPRQPYPDRGMLEPDYEFFFNSWTQEDWINGPSAEDARYEIDWVKFFPMEE